MSRYRLLPPRPAGGAAGPLRARPVHVEPGRRAAHHWHPGRTGAPGYLEQCRQLTQARAGHSWLAAGSQTVQQQALRDFSQAMTAFFNPANPAGRPSWRKAGQHEGFRIVGRGRQWDVRRVSCKAGQVWVPKAGWVRFRWSRAVPPGAKSYRVTMDRAGRWHVAFAVIPAPVPAPGSGQAVGIDRGVAVSAALSTGEMLYCPALTGRERARLRRLRRKLAVPGAARSAAGGSDARSPGCGSGRVTGARTGRRRPARASRGGSNLVRVEDLKIKNMTRSRGARGTTGPERPGQGRAEPGDPGVGVGAAGAPAAGQGAGPGGEDQAAVHEPAVLGVRAGGPGLA